MLENLQLFFGDASHALARIYARLPRAGLPANCVLTGRVSGPTCEYARTLPATVSFVKPRRVSAAEAETLVVDSGHSSPHAPREESEAETLVVEAILPDPCFWSQETPFVYRAELELKSDGQSVASAERLFGIRPLGARGRNLVWEGRRWVARAADCLELPERLLAAWRAADLALLVSNPGDALCAEATRLGAVLIADLTADEEELPRALRRLARWPAVTMALVASGATLAADIRSGARNLLLAEHRDAASATPPGSQADLVICEAASTAELVRLAGDLTIPALAWRAAGWCDDLAAARRQCDVLQRDL
ncbi:MAG TPA: hypothetical protein VF278_05670, partial [Pirellulales bacterium]